MQPQYLTTTTTTVPTVQCIMHVLETCTYFSQKYLQNSKPKNSTKYTLHAITLHHSMTGIVNIDQCSPRDWEQDEKGRFYVYSQLSMLSKDEQDKVRVIF